MTLQERLHQNLCQTNRLAQSWFEAKRKDRVLPIYSSYDIRDSGNKIACVDANIYPGGFNNVCRIDREECPSRFRDYVHRTYGSRIQKIALLTEEHTQNLYYWDNVFAIREMLTSAGFDVRIGVPKLLEKPFQITSASGFSMEVCSAIREGAGVRLNEGSGLETGKGFVPDLVVCNNDFSDAHAEWTAGVAMPFTPPWEMGWFQRKKHRFFKHYNLLAGEFAQVIGVDAWFLTVETEHISDFDMNYADERDALATRVDGMLARIRSEYARRGVGDKPTVFIKNNSGTYGIAVTSVQSGDEVRNWNAKSRKRMTAAKGGREVEELILQEGVPTAVQRDGVTAEPVIYMIGHQLAGGFLRAHGEKGVNDNLNSPGSVFKSLCMSDLQVRCEKCPMENVYGWVAKLSLLAIEAETREMGVSYYGALDPFAQTRELKA